jgi:excisionase family DNA binding protein
MNKDKYYTIDEVAEILRVAYMTVYRWIKAGKLNAIKAGKQFRISEKCLNDFITDSNKNEQTK